MSNMTPQFHNYINRNDSECRLWRSTRRLNMFSTAIHYNFRGHMSLAQMTKHQPIMDSRTKLAKVIRVKSRYIAFTTDNLNTYALMLCSVFPLHPKIIGDYRLYARVTDKPLPVSRISLFACHVHCRLRQY